MVAAMMNWSLEKVRILDPERLAEANLDVVRTVAQVLVFLSKVPASGSALGEEPNLAIPKRDSRVAQIGSRGTDFCVKRRFYGNQ